VNAEVSACPLCTPRLLTPVVRETRHWRTAINRNQNLLGKVIVVLRRHEEDVAGLDPDEWRDLLEDVRWATDGIQDAFAPGHFNYAFLQNQDRHVHLHVIPRYASARVLAGIEFVDPDYPDHYRVPAPERLVDADVLELVAAAVARK
jgi:diadenosine tetraphosphate (Ap4A) HIT family hydrolase